LEATTAASGPATPTDGVAPTLDDESRDWLHSLGAECRSVAIVRLRALLLCAARFEVARRRDQVTHVDDRELDKLAHAAADAALIRAVAQLGRYRGASRFTTWAAKYAVREAAARTRKLGWRGGQATSTYSRQR
jgi:RNA polymerase sigma-70 factor, ECF subfamily